MPKKSMGQNFLIDENIVKKIVKAGNVNKKDIIVEIGPGTGSLTLELAKHAKKVIAIEKDEKLASQLKIKNTEIIVGDALEEIKKIPGKYKVVSNIPYYLTSFLIRTLLELENKPIEIILLIQKEVAKRICSPKNNILSLSVNYYAKPEIVGYVSKNCFYPKPKVDSAIIKITPNKKKKNNELFKIIKLGFTHPRKTLVNNLKEIKIEDFLKNRGLDLKIRPEKLSIKDWLDLQSFIQRKKS